MLQNLETFARLHAPFYGQKGLSAQWAENVYTKLAASSAFLKAYPEQIGMLLWSERRAEREEGLRLNLFCVAAMCQGAMKCTSSPSVLKVLYLGYEWGCRQTEELRQQLAEMEDEARKGWDETPGAHYMEHAQKAIMVALSVCKLAEGLAEDDEGYRVDNTRYDFAALFRCYADMEAMFLQFQDRLQRRELVYCRDGVVAWNSAYKRKWFQQELPLPHYDARVTNEMTRFVLMLLRLPTYPEVSGKVAA